MPRAGELFAPLGAAALVVLTFVVGHGCGHGRERGAPSDAAVTALAPPSSAIESDASLEAEENAPRGNLSFEVVDKDTALPIPCKLSFFGVGRTPTPRLSRREVPLAIDGGIASYGRVFSLAGRGGLKLPQGSYDVYVSHGPEWSVAVERGVRVGDKPVQISAKLEHVLPTPGLVSADLHVHAAPSWDSVVPLAARVQEFAAEGVDVLVATDHNTVSDYAPEIDKLGAQKLLGSVRGSEVSTIDWGHFGAFPVNPEPDWWVLHGVRMRGMNARELLQAVRKHDPAALVTVNHPRMGLIGYFTRAEFNRATASFLKPNASLDFDAVEVINGYQGAGREQIEAVLADWFALILHGHRVTGVGNSDTHHMHYAIAGYPRNYVAVADDSPGKVSGDELADALKAGKSFFSTGPLIELDIDGKHMGDVVPAGGRSVTLHLRVRAAPWVSVTNVRVLVDGTLARGYPVGDSDKIDRFQTDVPISVERDAFVVVVAEGQKLSIALARGPGKKALPSFAVSNPVWLDVDGNGRYDAPMK